MNTIIDYIKSPQFWFCTVIVSILTNLFTHWLTQKFPNLLSKLSVKWATRTSKLKEERNKRIATLANNPQQQIYCTTVAIYLRNRANMYFILVTIAFCFIVLEFVVQGIFINAAILIHDKTNHNFGAVFNCNVLMAFLFAALGIRHTFRADSLI